MRHVIVGICGALSVAPVGAQSFFWNTSTFVTPPTAGLTYTLSYDVARARTVAVGTSGTIVETWEYDGSAWNELVVPGPVPDPMASAYDATSNRVLVVTSREGQRTRLWQWNGSNWSEQISTHTPPARDFASVAYDTARGVLLLFGGVVNGVPLSDTWQWDGTDWVQRGSGGPPARYQASMQFDPVAQRIVLFGGRTGATLYGDTWEWTGNGWIEHFGIAGPAPRAAAGMSYDSLRSRVVLYGGSGTAGANLTDLWQWNGSAWTQRTSPTTPPGRGPIAYDSTRDALVLLAQNGAVLETWNYSPYTLSSATFDTFGIGCAGGGGVPTLDAAGTLPIVGETLDVRVSGLPQGPFFAVIGLAGISKTMWGATPLPLDLVILGMPGCLLRITPDFVSPMPVSAGAAHWMLPIPADQKFVGVQFHVQALILDPPANPFGATVTNAGTVTIGNN